MSMFTSKAEFLAEGTRPVLLEDLEPDATCSICMEEYSEGSEYPLLLDTCHHIFGSDCLALWDGNRCPMCRAELWEIQPPPRWEAQSYVEDYEHSDLESSNEDASEDDEDASYDQAYNDSDDGTIEYITNDPSPHMSVGFPTEQPVPHHVFDPSTFFPRLRAAQTRFARTPFERSLVARNHRTGSWHYAARSLPAYGYPRRAQPSRIVSHQADRRRYAVVPVFETPCPADLLRCHHFNWRHEVGDYCVTVRASLCGQALRDFARFCAPLGMVRSGARGGGGGDRQRRVLAQIEHVALPAVDAWYEQMDGTVVTVREARDELLWAVKRAIGRGNAYAEGLFLVSELIEVVLTWRVCREVEVYGYLL